MPMAPPTSSAPAKKGRRQPATLDATPIAKPTQRASARKSVRLQNKAAPIAKPTQLASARKSVRLQNKAPVSRTPQPQPVQISLTRSAPISQSAPAKRKRSQDSEAEANEPTRPRKLPSPHLELSEKNLRRFNGEEMGSAANKRPWSRRSITESSDVTQDTPRSQRSSGSTAFYRFTHLAAAEVYIHTDPPADIQNAIDAIVKAEPSKERRDELEAISKKFHGSCKEAVKATTSEDNFILLFISALQAMNHNSLYYQVKVDLRKELKPKIQEDNTDFSVLNRKYIAGNQHQEVDDAPALSQKRQQQSTPANKPLEPGTMAPPPLPREKGGNRSPIKTPRPDILIGIKHEALLSALSSQNLDNPRAKKFLERLQNNMISREPDRPQEPMLISMPAPLASNLVYPFAVLEGKAYSTGTQVFEAENQVAVSGACGLKIQLCLNELANDTIISSDTSPTLSNISLPLFFSICTQGPIHELWAHYTHVEYGVRKFNMVLLKICHGVLLDSVMDFIVAADNVFHWGTGQFMESVVERLGEGARKVWA